MTTAQRIVDLDAVVPDDIGVKVGGEVYKIPGDIDVPIYLELTKLLGDGDEEDDRMGPREQLEALADLTLEILQVHQPALEELPRGMGPRRMATLLGQVYAGLVAQDAAVEDPPKPPAETPRPRRRTGTRNTSKTKSTKSRSSKS